MVSLRSVYKLYSQVYVFLDHCPNSKSVKKQPKMAKKDQK